MPGCNIDDQNRVLAIGDLHGNYEGLVQILRKAGLLNDKDEWIAENTHLVQLGDIFGRGGFPGKILSLFARLQEESASVNSSVQVLLGNHEVMSLMGMFSYITPEEAEDLLSFFSPSPGSPQDWQPVNQNGNSLDRQKLWKTYAGSLKPSGNIGDWIRGWNTAVVINETIFVHGGLSQEFAMQPLEELNLKIRHELNRELVRDESGRLLVPSVLWERGPHWNRKFIVNRDKEMEAQLYKVLEFHHCKRMVVGHTPTGIIDPWNSGKILPLYEGSLICIDTGIGEAYGSNLAALEITGNVAKPFYP